VARQGQSVGGYELHQKLAGGGFATVWRTRAKNGRPAAIKILHADLLEHRPDHGPSIVDRFLIEVRILERLEHPGLVNIFDVIEGDEDGNYAYVMELLTGFELRHIVPHIQLLAVVETFREVATTLGYVHANGVIHRDVTVRNILVCNQEAQAPTVKLIDFGIAKDQGADVAPPSTMTGHFTGVLGTMAPECFDRIQSMSDELLTGAVDQWSIGIAMYQCLTGRLPFGGAGPALLIEQIRKDDPPPMVPMRHYGLDCIPPPVDAIVRRCLSKDPKDRYASADALERALDGACRALSAQHDSEVLADMLTQAQSSAEALQDRTVVVPVASLGDHEVIGAGEIERPGSTAPDATQLTDPEATIRINTDRVKTPPEPLVFPHDGPTPAAESPQDPTDPTPAVSDPIHKWDQLMDPTVQVADALNQETELAVPAVEDATEVRVRAFGADKPAARVVVVVPPRPMPSMADDESLVRPVHSAKSLPVVSAPDLPRRAAGSSSPQLASREMEEFVPPPQSRASAFVVLMVALGLAVVLAFFLGWTISGA